MEVLTRKGAWLIGLTLLCWGWSGTSAYSRDDEKLAKKVGGLDAQLLKTLAELAKKYDDAKDPEAAHFFASCALGFGSKDEKLPAIKAGWEASLYIGKLKGGKVLEDVNAIDVALRGVAYEYKKVIDELVPRRKELGESTRTLLLDLGPRYELARGAQDYIRATQRINAFRQARHLRPLLWDFEMSRKCIMATWYMAETGDYDDNQEFSKKQADPTSVFYGSYVKEIKGKVSVSPQADLKDYPEKYLSTVWARMDLFNPNARVLWLGRWTRGKMANLFTSYAIPPIPYRTDIPTPTARFKDETVVKDHPGWVDTEDTVLIEESGKKRRVPFVCYPYPGDVEVHTYLGQAESTWWKLDIAKKLEKSGMPVMVRFYDEGEIADLKVTIFDSQGAIVPSLPFTNGDNRLPLGELPIILVIPEKELAKSSRYTVELKCRFASVPFEKKWSFETGSK